MLNNLRGFDTDDELVVKKKFEDICLFLNVGTIELSRLAKVRNTRLYRAEILDREQRILLLRNVKGLKDSQLYKSVNL